MKRSTLRSTAANAGLACIHGPKKIAAFAALLACAAFAQPGFALSPYSQNFESLSTGDGAALSNDGWLVGGNVWNDAALTSFAYGYFSFAAPNGGAAWSAIDTGQGGAPQGAQQLSAYNDYNNADHGNGKYIQAHLFQEQFGAISAADVGKTYSFTFDSKPGNLVAPSTADAFVKVLKSSDGSFAQLFIDSITTHTLGASWATNTINVTILAAWVGETLQFGFRNVATAYNASGVFYDNVNFSAPSPDTDDDGNPDSNDPNVNTATVAADSGPAPAGAATNFDVLANDDFLPNNDPNNVGTTTLTDTGNGTAGGTIVPNATTGEIAYTPLAGEAGSSVTVEYEVCNTDPAPDVCGTTILTVNVTATGAGCTVPCTLIWEDTFTGTSLDLGKWEYQIGDGSNYGVPGWGNNELQYYRDGSNNTTVGPDAQATAGGVLTITAKQENFGGKPYTSARVRTRNQGDWAYGRFEARIKLPQNQGATTGGQGTWPAFWLLPYNSPYGGRGWPFHGEIDIMEWLGHEPNDLFGTIHYPCCGPGNPTSANDSGTTTLPSPLDWHTYAVEWEPGVMRWYLDNSPTPFLTKNSWSSGNIPFQAPFDVPNFHVILNLAIGGNFPGDPDGTSIFPQEFKIDYVRVYDLGGASATITPTIPPVTDPILLDDFEHNDSVSQWGLYTDPAAGGGRGNTTSVPPTDGGGNAMDVGFGGSQGAFWGTVSHNQSMDLSGMTQLSFWINPDGANNQDYNLEINIQDDDSGEGNWTSNGLDDEFQYTCRVSSSGPCATVGGGWQKVTIPLSSFAYDTSFVAGGNGILDTAAGGNGLAETITIAIVDNAGGATAADFQTDYWLFEGADPCVPSQFGAGCTIDTDGDGDPDSVEGEFTDTDGDGAPDYQESSIVDTDSDGVNDEADVNNTDPCIPSAFNAACTQDTDGDGETDFSEGELTDTDGDSIPDYQESSIADSDSDGTSDELDPANADPCIPTTFVSTCAADDDGDGKTNFTEGPTSDVDGDGIPDYQDSATADSDGDGVVDELDPNNDPCIPSQFGTGCTTDTDGDGDADSVEGEFTDSDGDGTPDYQESSIVDTDSDGVNDEADVNNTNPCIPSAFNSACTQDTDGDGESDFSEGEATDTDGDGIPDYQESSIDDFDSDGTPNESDPGNLDPCVPNTGASACGLIPLVGYSQDFENLAVATPGVFDTALENEGWQIFANVHDGVGAYPGAVKFYYGPFLAPNEGSAFSTIATGDNTDGFGAPIDAGIGLNYLNVFSDYQCCGPGEGGSEQGHNDLEDPRDVVHSLVFLEYRISASDIGSSVMFSFDAKRPADNNIAVGNGCTLPCTASAFVKTLNPGAATGPLYPQTSLLTEDMTNISQSDWTSYSIVMDLSDPSLEGQILQVGFQNFSSQAENTGVYYDNVSLTTTVPNNIPLPWFTFAGIMLLLGATGISARKKHRETLPTP